ncbi:hypothetical protein [Cohaesibacter celericrescens]|uniref:Flagellar protein FlgN n=1 Tax=Cohaesibacter celericrescens TaxID=2067669 RepID=A0A2N5XWI8_9HYPH|nr:hypothetical protein [Cohaesibacter celericrescens]PLW78849.1 hypothetical protein C0081_00990 [Cohaesibacter celericrescens]
MSEQENKATSPVTQAATLAKSPIASPDDVRRLVGAIEHIMDALDDVMGEETKLLKEGKVKQALDLVEAKNQLSIQYMLLQKAITANASLVKQMAPQDSEQLTRRHHMFQSTLQANLAVIATVREVSSELVHDINDQVQKGGKANTYGQSGQLPQHVTQRRGLSIDTAS